MTETVTTPAAAASRNAEQRPLTAEEQELASQLALRYVLIRRGHVARFLGGFVAVLVLCGVLSWTTAKSAVATGAAKIATDEIIALKAVAAKDSAEIAGFKAQLPAVLERVRQYETGTVTAPQEGRPWTLNRRGGKRSYETVVKFAHPVQNPRVSVALSGFNNADHFNVRAIAVTDTQFTLVFEADEDDVVYGATATWFVYASV